MDGGFVYDDVDVDEDYIDYHEDDFWSDDEDDTFALGLVVRAVFPKQK